jgi:glycosyltransferase involved in cell wall biosynthesis
LEQIPEAEVHVISCAQQPMRSQEKIADNIWFHGLHVPKLGWMRAGYQGCIRAVRRRLKAIRPEIVHGQGTERDCSLAASWSGWPNVITIHGHMGRLAALQRSRPFTFPWFAAWLESVAVRRTGGVVCLSRYSLDNVRTRARRTWVVPNAVSEEFFQLRRDPAEEKQILVTAHVHPWKNQNSLINALDPLAKELQFLVLFLGKANADTDYGREFLRLVGARPWCRHLGVATRDQIRQALSRATGLVLPSLEDNCPMAVLEAMAAGVPVAGARVGGVPDLIKPGQTGRLFEASDQSDIRQNVRSMLEDSDQTRALADNARRLALELLRPEIVARRHMQIYQEVLRGRLSATRAASQSGQASWAKSSLR